MSATNHTTNYELPVFIGTDKPAWLVDWNGAMNAIDTAIKQVETKADAAGVDIGSIQSDIITINSALTTLNGAVSQLRIDTNANTGAINTIQELIGNGTPTTTDHTLIGAINELHSDIQEISGEVYDFNIQPVSGVTVVANANITLNSEVTDINALLNSDSSVGKIYGAVFGTATAGILANTALFTITIPGLDTETAYDIKGYDLIRLTGSDAVPLVAYLHFNVGNTVEIRCANSVSTSDVIWSNLCPCLLFLKDLGD